MKCVAIADDVKLGRDVRIYNFVNLYGCEIGDETRIGTFVEIQQLAQLAAVDDAADPPHRAVVHERVIDHQPDALLRRQLAQRFGFAPGCRERLFDEHVLARLDGGARQRKMRAERRRDDDGVDPIGVYRRRGGVGDRDARVTARGGGSAVGALVGDRRKAQPVGLRDVPREVRSPVAVAEDSDPNLFHEISDFRLLISD